MSEPLSLAQLRHQARSVTEVGWVPFFTRGSFARCYASGTGLDGTHATAGIYHAFWRYGGDVATRNTRAAGDASYWRAARRGGSAMGRPHGWIRPGPGRGWLHRGPQCRH